MLVGRELGMLVGRELGRLVGRELGGWGVGSYVDRLVGR